MREEYKGVITNYRRGPKSQRNQECLLKVLDVTPKECMKLVGWKVGWPLEKSRLSGVISKTHGKTGTLRVKFHRGLPGQALGTKVKIINK